MKNCGKYIFFKTYIPTSIIRHSNITTKHKPPQAFAVRAKFNYLFSNKNNITAHPPFNWYAMRNG